MKTIVISSGDLTMGGLQKVLVEYLKLIDKNKYRIVLLIANDYGKKNLFLEEIPKNVEIQFVRPYNLVSKIAELSKKRKILNRVLLKGYRHKSKRVFKSIFLEKLSKLGKIDLIIDFDGGLKSVLDNLKAEKKIIWIHSSIRKHKQDNKSKISRYGEELKKYDKIIAICQEMKEEIKELYPSLSHKIEYIYNPLDCNNIIEQGNENIEKITSYEKELIESDYFLAISRLDVVQKDFETLIEGYSILKNSNVKEKKQKISSEYFEKEKKPVRQKTLQEMFEGRYQKLKKERRNNYFSRLKGFKDNDEEKRMIEFREQRLKEKLDLVKDDFDFIFIDCPPSLGLITLNSFTAADSVLIPVQCEYFALEGLGQLINTINLVKKHLNNIVNNKINLYKNWRDL